MNKEETGAIVAVIIASCPAQSARFTPASTVAMINAYSSLLADLSYEQCDAACRLLLQTRTWMPSVAEIRSAALDLTRGAVRAGGEAWGSVTKAIREQGSWRTPGTDFVFNDPVTARCVALMNWGDLCASENSVADRARFIELYDKLATETRREAQSPMLSAARQQREVGGQAQQIGNLIALVAGKDEP